jgi:predicted DNA-binding transcriptional regulator AlpA
MPKKKLVTPVDLTGRLILDAAALMAATTWSKSTVRRAIRGELAFRNPFPAPIKLGGMKNNFWPKEALEKWLAAELAAE